MSEFSALNYTEQGGEVTHIGGVLVIEPGAEVVGSLGPQMPPMEDSTATTVAQLKEDFNTLLAYLRLSGLMDQGTIILK